MLDWFQTIEEAVNVHVRWDQSTWEYCEVYCIQSIENCCELLCWTGFNLKWISVKCSVVRVSINMIVVSCHVGLVSINTGLM